MRVKIAYYVDKWLAQGYPEGIPDEAPSRLEDLNKVPSYRLICKAIIKNDYSLQTLGYSRQPCELYGLLKRKELLSRGDESIIRRK